MMIDEKDLWRKEENEERSDIVHDLVDREDRRSSNGIGKFNSRIPNWVAVIIVLVVLVATAVGVNLVLKQRMNDGYFNDSGGVGFSQSRVINVNNTQDNEALTVNQNSSISSVPIVGVGSPSPTPEQRVEPTPEPTPVVYQTFSNYGYKAVIVGTKFPEGRVRLDPEEGSFVGEFNKLEVYENGILIGEYYAHKLLSDVTKESILKMPENISVSVYLGILHINENNELWGHVDLMYYGDPPITEYIDIFKINLESQEVGIFHIPVRTINEIGPLQFNPSRDGVVFDYFNEEDDLQIAEYRPEQNELSELVRYPNDLIQRYFNYPESSTSLWISYFSGYYQSQYRGLHPAWSDENTVSYQDFETREWKTVDVE